MTSDIREKKVMQPPEPRLFFHIGAALGLVREVWRGLTQTECARRAGITKAQVSRLEIGFARPSLESLEKILPVLEVGPAEFFAIVAALDRMAAGEESMEAIKQSVLERQQSALEEWLGRVAPVRLHGARSQRLSGRWAAWSKTLWMAEAESPVNQTETTPSETGDAQAC